MRNGTSAPQIAPATTASAAMVMIWMKNAAKISAPSAPRLLKIAISGRLRSRKAEIAWPAPTPPTARTVSPVRVRNIVT